MKLKSLFLILTVAFWCQSSTAQTVIFEDKQVVPDTIRSDWGPNAKHHLSGVFGFGWPVQPSNPGAEIKYFLSADIHTGIRYRRQWASWFATGAELQYVADIYRLKQKTGKVLPDSTLNDRERLSFQSFQLGLFARFNFGARGDRTGNFLDLGAYGDLYFLKKHKTRNDLPSGERVVTTTRRLQYGPTIGYGVRARLGFGSFVLVASYRISDFFDDNPEYPELPRWKLGFEFAF